MKENHRHETTQMRGLERMALTILRALRILMESGANAKVLHEAARMLGKGMKTEVIGLRVGYASITLTLSAHEQTMSSTVTVGRLGVNHRLDHGLRDLIAKAAKGGMDVGELDQAISKLVERTPRHAAWFVALCVGVACASFGRLFGMDWLGFPAAFIGASVGQYLRHTFIHKGMNVYVVAAFIAFLASLITGVGAKLLGCQTINLAMVASILFLVPGVPSANAQADILDGYPTLGSARAITVLMTMIFATIGIWVSQTFLGVR